MFNSEDNNEATSVALAITKIVCMILFFCLILVVGSLPIRLRAFKSNKRLLSYTAAFSGGLFLSVGVIHLLPEAAGSFEEYYDEQGEEGEHFPFAYTIAIASFALILFIEKIATDHHHSHGDSDHDHPTNSKKSYIHSAEQNQLFVENAVDDKFLINHSEIDKPNISEEEQFKQSVNTKLQVAKKISFVSMVRKSIAEDPKQSAVFQNVNTWAPYILQIAIGIHAVFEGLSIGIQNQVSLCIGIALAVTCHKWAEGLTLGLAYRQAGVPKKEATIQIAIQAIMNPIGIAIGWALSGGGPLISGIFVSISVGTFVYISTVEVIVEEFSISRYKWQKYFIFISAIIFVSLLWFLEQLTEGGDEE